MRLLGLARGEGDELDAAIRVEGIDERLRKGREAAEKGLAVVKVGEALCGIVSDRCARVSVGRLAGPGWFLMPPQS